MIVDCVLDVTDIELFAYPQQVDENDLSFCISKMGAFFFYLLSSSVAGSLNVMPLQSSTQQLPICTQPICVVS